MTTDRPGRELCNTVIGWLMLSLICVAVASGCRPAAEPPKEDPCVRAVTLSIMYVIDKKLVNDVPQVDDMIAEVCSAK